MISPGKFNRQILLKNYGSVKGANGGLTRTLLDSATVWAQVENKTGSVLTNQGQVQWQDYTRITIRFQKRFNSNWVIEYEGFEYQVTSLSVENEGYKEYLIFKCGSSKKIIIDVEVNSFLTEDTINEFITQNSQILIQE